MKKAGRALTAEHEVTLGEACGTSKLRDRKLIIDSTVSNPSPLGSVAPGFALEREIEHEVMGLIDVCLSSQSLVVAGYLSLTIAMPAVLQNMRLESVRISLHQEYSLRSLRNADQQELIKNTSLPIWSTKRSRGPIGQFAPGEAYSLAKQLRMNPNTVIRPSTAKWSRTGIRISHMIAVTISYTPLEGSNSMKTDDLTITSPVTIASCCCMMAELQLPAYEEKKESTVGSIDRSQIAFCTNCLVSHDHLDVLRKNLALTRPKCTLAEGVDLQPEDYGVSEDDLKRALQWKTKKTTSWKNDEEYERSLCKIMENPSQETVAELHASECGSVSTTRC